MKDIEILERYTAKLSKLDKDIEKQRDIYWQNFLNNRAVLIDRGYIVNDYPTAKGITISQIRAENELFIAEILFSGLLDNLSPAELASVICAITTEEMRTENYSILPLSQNVRKTINKIRDLRKKLDKVQKNHDVETVMNINTFYSALIEMWVNGAEWDTIINEIDRGEGDIVRIFKRTIDVLRQLCTIDNVPESIVFTAREAIDCIDREPIDVD